MSKFQVKDGTTIFYKTDGSGFPVVLISGGFCDHRVWDGVVEEIATAYQVVTYDHRGAGQSDSTEGEYTVELLANDLIQLFDYLGIQSAHVVGHSMGGFVAQYFAAHYPEKVVSVSLLSSILAMNQAGKEFLSVIVDDAKNQPEELILRLSEIAGVRQPITSILQQTELCKNYDANAYIHKIYAPAFIASGMQEPIMNVSETKILGSAIKTVLRSTILDCGHMLPLEMPDELTRELLHFFRQTEGKLHTLNAGRNH